MNRHSFLLAVCGLAACAVVPDKDPAPDVTKAELVETLQKALALLKMRDAQVEERDLTIEELHTKLEVECNQA